MKLKLTLVVAMTLACASIQLTAMPTEEETRKAEPVVKKMLAQERAALESGKKTRSEVAAAAMKLAGEADTDAAKLLLMKGAFALYVKDGNLEKAVETMKTLEAAISDMPPQSVTNMIEMALLGVSKKEDGARLYKLLDETKADIASRKESTRMASSEKERSSIASILSGMIKVPGRDYWLSETELTQGQWESVMGYNLSHHKGANLPVENVSRDDCDVFLEKLNKTREVQDSQFEFSLPTLDEWRYAAQAGGSGMDCWIKPGVVGNVLDMAWIAENSSNETHAVALKVPNAFGFYDTLGNVWELMNCEEENIGCRHGGSFHDAAANCTVKEGYHNPRNHRIDSCGLRLFARMRTQAGLPRRGLQHLQEDGRQQKSKSALDAAEMSEVKLPYEVVDGAVVLGKRQSFGYGRQDKGELKDERKVVTVKITSGELVIPDIINGIPVRSIGTGAFADCKGLVSVTIPSSVTSIAENAFAGRNGMSWSQPVSGLKSFSVDSDNPSYSSRNGMLCTKDGSTLVAGVIGVNGSVTIPSSVVRIGSSAFSNCSGLRCVTIPDSVTSIGSGAFRNCRGLISVAIPSSVGRIGHGAFYGCSGLTSVTIADGVASIGDSAFSGCEKLKSVTIPSSVESIGRSAFFRCGSIMSFLVGAENANYKSVNGMLLSRDGTTLVAGVNGDVVIPDGVTSIGEAAFFTRWSLRSLTIPDSVTSIGEAAFLSCSALKGVAIPDSVTNIGERAFTGFSGSFTVGNNNPSYKSISGLLLTKDGTTLVAGWGVKGDVAIPSGVTNIKEIAFFNCSLTSVTMPSSVTSIGRGAFDECSRLTSVTIGDGVTSIGRGAFCFCSGLTTVTMLGERPDAPNEIFKGCGKLKAIRVPANAKSWAGMKDWFGIPLVFDGELKTSRFGPAQLSSARRSAELETDHKWLEAADGQKTYGGYTWSYRVRNDEATLVAEKDGKYSCAVSPTPTGNVTIPPTLNYIKVTRIGQDAFRNCKELTSVTIPEGVTHIDVHAFDNCIGLKSVSLPSSLMGIGYAAFGKCEKLTSVTIPNGVKNIESDSFNGCRELKSVVIPESVTHIGDRAFCGCRELESVAIPAGVARIGNGVFGDCNALKVIQLDSGNQAFTLIDGVLYTKDRSELVMYPNPSATVVIPEGVTSIRGWAFTGGSGMTSVTIPESVTNIKDHAFLRCDGLKAITIPSSVKNIGVRAFEQCAELTEVTMLGERPEAPENLFFPGCGKLKAIHVPANAKSWAGMKDWFGIPLECDIEANHW